MNEPRLKVSGIIFIVIAALHLLRFLKHWEVTIAGVHVSLWASVVAAVVFLMLGLWNLKPFCCKQ